MRPSRIPAIAMALAIFSPLATMAEDAPPPGARPTGPGAVVPEDPATKDTGEPEKGSGDATAETGTGGAGSDTPAGWKWAFTGMLSANGGYQRQASLSTFAKPDTSTPSATSGISASAGPEVGKGGFKSGLSYEFSQSFYSYSKYLDTQNHGAQLYLRWKSDRFYVKGSYQFDASFFPFDSFDVYSLNQTAKLKVEGGIYKIFWAGVKYTFAFWGVQAEANKAYRGRQHVVKVYPELRFSDEFKAGLSYQLEATKLGEMETQRVVFNQTIKKLQLVDITIPLSYVGHFGSAYASYSPIDTLDLSTEVRLGRKTYPDMSAENKKGKHYPEKPRHDTVVDVSFNAGWEFHEDLTLDLAVYYIDSSSNIEAKKASGSYWDIQATAGLSWVF